VRPEGNTVSTEDTYQPVRAAAEQRAAGESGGAWRLADRVLDHIPNGENHGGDRRSSVGAPPLLIARLTDLATRLTNDGVETPQGLPYTADGLGELRKMAMAWPPDTRWKEAAYRTHEEAGGSDNPKRSILSALCFYADTGTEQRPSGVNIINWRAAITLVDTAKQRGSRYVVSANALRVAAGGKANAGERLRDGEATNVAERIARDPGFAREVAEAVESNEEAYVALAKAQNETEQARTTHQSRERRAHEQEAAEAEQVYHLSGFKLMPVLLECSALVEFVEERVVHETEDQDKARLAGQWLQNLGTRLVAWADGLTEPLSDEDFEAGIEALIGEDQ